MLDLYKLTGEIFERFASEEYGTQVKWQYLGSKRQKLWYKDTLLIALRLIGELRKEVKPIPPGNSKTNTSYNLGFLEGQRQERTMLITLLQKYHNELIADYKNLED